MEGIKLKDLPSFLRTTDLDDDNGIMLNFALGEVENARNASALIFNTFEELENDRGKEDWLIFAERELIGPPPRIKRGRPRFKRIPEQGEGEGSINASRGGRELMQNQEASSQSMLKFSNTKSDKE
ncbi:hypothetical protein ACFE04_015137 [Oxalis oulophora]